MSIYDEIQNRIIEGRLFLLEPALPDAAHMRRVFASSDVNSLLLGPWDDTDSATRCNYLRADIDKFIEGQIVTVAQRSRAAGVADLAQLQPQREEVWEIRSRNPKPSLRVFGRFADTDVFIALTWSPRIPLAGWGSRAWRDAIVGCKTEWAKLFTPYPPKSGAEIHDYISTQVVLV
jgi:hypothetical protein